MGAANLMALYTVVNQDNQVMAEQPYVWDGARQVDLPDGWRLVPQADAPRLLGFRDPFAEHTRNTGNTTLLRRRAMDAHAGNNVYLADPAPNPAAVVAQVRRLTQQHQTIIRLLLGQVSAVDVEDNPGLLGVGRGG